MKKNNIYEGNKKKVKEQEHEEQEEQEEEKEMRREIASSGFCGHMPPSHVESTLARRLGSRLAKSTLMGEGGGGKENYYSALVSRLGRSRLGRCRRPWGRCCCSLGGDIFGYFVYGTVEGRMRHSSAP